MMKRQKKFPYALGCQDMTPEIQDKMERISLKKRLTRDTPSRPKQLLLTEFLPPVGDQGQQNSCVGWSTAYYAYTYAVAKQRGLTQNDLKNPKWQFSPAFIYHNREGDRNEDKGMNFYQSMQILKEKGCATFTEMPYNDKDPSTPVSEGSNRRAVKFKALVAGVFANHEKPFDPEAAKTLMNELRTPLLISIPVYGDFQGADPKAVYAPKPNQESEGGHAITLIGYDDDRKAFRMINSWTEQWGDKGQLWLSEEWLAKSVRLGALFIAGGGWARAKPGEGVRPGENWRSIVTVMPPKRK